MHETFARAARNDYMRLDSILIVAKIREQITFHCSEFTIRSSKLSAFEWLF